MGTKVLAPTEEELRSELCQALVRLLQDSREEGGDGALTTYEIAQIVNWPQKAVRERLRPLVEAGTVEPCRVYRRRIDGFLSPISAYRLVMNGHDQADN